MPESKARFIYSSDYYCNIGNHVFRTEKYGLLYERLISEGIVKPKDVIIPPPATRTQLELVHTPEYIDDLLSCRHTSRTITSEMPISRDIIDAFIIGAGGSIKAGRTAVEEHTAAMNLAGGFHHAFANHAEGFCYINDVAVTAACLLDNGDVESVMVVDCDLHQGNGTAHIFRDEPRAFTFSIHQENNYPCKQKSDLDVGLPDYCSGEEYLRQLHSNLTIAFRKFTPEVIIYIAGADPYEHDQLGLLNLTKDELRQRDEIVCKMAVERDIPLATLLAGGYAVDVNDTVDIHFNTALTLIELTSRYDS